jgi:hypothetical protein
MFDHPTRLLLGLVTGIAFGFLLQKGRVAKFHVIMGQFLLRDWTVVKVMATAVAVGVVGVWFLVQTGVATLHVKPAQFGGVILGGILLGAGLAVFGYCPGTSVAACGEGRRNAAVGVLGMLAGAATYVALYPALRPVIKGIADWGKITFPQLTYTPPWAWVAGLVGAVVLFLSVLGRFSHRALAVRTRLVLLIAFLVAQAGLVMPAAACPVCDTGTGQQVRAGILDDSFGRTLLAVVLPFPLLLAVVAGIHFGWPPLGRKRVTSTDGDVRHGTDDNHK